MARDSNCLNGNLCGNARYHEKKRASCRRRGKPALFRCCDAPQKIKKERKGEERRERKRRKEGKEERKRRKGKEGKEERKGRKGKGKKGERKRRGKEGEEVVTKVSRVDMGRA